MDDTEAPWIAAARRGDASAFRRLVERHARPLHRTCARILGDASAAEDALQDALLDAWRGLDRFDGRSAFGTWLHRIAVNAALGHLRRRRPETTLPQDDDCAEVLLPEDGDPFDHASGAQWRARLGQALGELSAAERSAFVLRHLEHYPLQEIAAALDSNVNATKQAIFRAVRKLRDAMRPIRSIT